MPISLNLTPFDHFRPTSGLLSSQNLAYCLMYHNGFWVNSSTTTTVSQYHPGFFILKKTTTTPVTGDKLIHTSNPLPYTYSTTVEDQYLNDIGDHLEDNIKVMTVKVKTTAGRCGKGMLYPGCKIDIDIDYLGNDITHQRGVATQQACAVLAASTEGGLFWTWHPNHCFVKSSDSGKTYKTGDVSGNIQCATGTIICLKRIYNKDVSYRMYRGLSLFFSSKISK